MVLFLNQMVDIFKVTTYTISIDDIFKVTGCYFVSNERKA